MTEEQIDLIVKKLRENDQKERDRKIAEEIAQFELGKLYYSPEREKVVRLFDANPKSRWKYFCDDPDGDGLEETCGEAFWTEYLWFIKDIRDEIADLEDQIENLEKAVEEITNENHN